MRSFRTVKYVTMIAIAAIFLAGGAGVSNAALSIAQTDLGAQVSFAVSVTSVPDAMDSFGFDVLYDYNTLHFTGNYTSGPLTQGLAFFGVNESVPGSLRIGGVGSVQQGQSGLLVTLFFDKIVYLTTYPATFANLTDDVREYATNPSGTPPVVWRNQAFRVYENSPNGTAFGMVTATDDDDETLDFSITGGDPLNAFSIDAGQGIIFVNDATRIDYGTTPSHTLSVGVSDGVDTTAATIFVKVLPFPADLNDDLVIDLQDAVLALQTVSGIHVTVASHGGKVGIREAVFILQVISALRD